MLVEAGNLSILSITSLHLFFANSTCTSIPSFLILHKTFCSKAVWPGQAQHSPSACVFIFLSLSSLPSPLSCSPLLSCFSISCTVQQTLDSARLLNEPSRLFSLVKQMAAEEDSIEEVVAARQERLRSLKAAQELLNTPDEDSGQVNNNTNDDKEINEDANTNMKFRNYVPHDKQLQEGKLVPPVLPKFEDPVAAVPPPSEKKEDPFVNIAPKKPNWELRRDVQKKFDKLEKRTQKAMCKLMEEQEKQKQLDEVAEMVQKTSIEFT